MSESKFIRSLKHDTPEKAAERFPGGEGESKLSTAAKRQAEEIRRDNVLEDMASSLEAVEVKDERAMQTEVIKNTLFDTIDSLIVEFDVIEMDKTAKERIKESLIETVLFIELARAKNEEQKVQIEKDTKEIVDALFAQDSLQVELQDRIEAYYQKKAQNAVSAFREISPNVIAPDEADQKFRELQNTGKDLMVPPSYIENMREEVINMWAQEYYDQE